MSNNNNNNNSTVLSNDIDSRWTKKRFLKEYVISRRIKYNIYKS